MFPWCLKENSAHPHKQTNKQGNRVEEKKHFSTHPRKWYKYLLALFLWNLCATAHFQCWKVYIIYIAFFYPSLKHVQFCAHRIRPNWSEWMKQRNQLEVEMVMLKAMMTVAMPTRSIHTHTHTAWIHCQFHCIIWHFHFGSFFSHSFPPLHALASLLLKTKLSWPKAFGQFI